MKRKLYLYILFLLPLFFIGCAFFPGLDFRPKRECPIETLILDEKLLPEGTYAEKLYSPSPDVPSESAYRAFYHAPDTILHEVIRWGFVRWAKEEFDSKTKAAFDVTKYEGPWEIPEEITFASQLADDYQFGCGTAHGTYQCRMVARYEEYSIYFKADVSEGGITLQTVEKLLKAIDDRMAECLGKQEQ